MIATKGYGFTVDMIDWSNPEEMKPYLKAHELELKEQDYMAWLRGQYFMSALDSTVCNCEFWRKRGSKPHEYVKRPILLKTESETGSVYKESQEEVAVFEMKQRINALRMSGLPESPE